MTEPNSKKHGKVNLKDPWVQAFLSPKLIEKFREILLEPQL